MRIYQIRLSGQMDEDFANAFCPAGTLRMAEGETYSAS